MWYVLSTHLKLSTHLTVTYKSLRHSVNPDRHSPRKFRNPVEKVDVEYPKLYYSNVCGPLIDIIYTVH